MYLIWECSTCGYENENDLCDVTIEVGLQSIAEVRCKKCKLAFIVNVDTELKETTFIIGDHYD